MCKSVLYVYYYKQYCYWYFVPRGSQRGENLYEITKITRIASDYWITRRIPRLWQDYRDYQGLQAGLPRL